MQHNARLPCLEQNPRNIPATDKRTTTTGSTLLFGTLHPLPTLLHHTTSKQAISAPWLLVFPIAQSTGSFPSRLLARKILETKTETPFALPTSTVRRTPPLPSRPAPRPIGPTAPPPSSHTLSSLIHYSPPLYPRERQRNVARIDKRSISPHP